MMEKEHLLSDGELPNIEPELLAAFSLAGIPEIQQGNEIGEVIVASMGYDIIPQEPTQLPSA